MERRPNINDAVDAVVRDGFCVLRGHFDRSLVLEWQRAFLPLFAHNLARGTNIGARGDARYYVTLPFEGIWAEPRFFDDDVIVAVVQKLVGASPVMCQLATDTPALGSDYQATHRDAPPLFPELEHETPAFQLAVNFPLVDVTLTNGPLEIARGTHMMSKDEGLALIESKKVALEPIEMKLGDVMIRDVRALHRGTPNKTEVPRPMVVIGYSRRWLYRPEVQIVIPKRVKDSLSPRAQHMLAFNPVVDELPQASAEVYQAYAY